MKMFYTLITLIFCLSVSLNAQTVDQTGNFSPVIDGTQIAYLEFSFENLGNPDVIDCAIALSKGPIAAYSDYSAVIAIYADGFKFRNGGSFGNEAVVIPVPGQVYKMWVTFNVPASTYTVDYQTEGVDSPVRLATDYGFRKTPVSDIDTWSCFHNPLAEPDVATVSTAAVVASVGSFPTGISGPIVVNNMEIIVQDKSISVLGVNSYEVYDLMGRKVAEVLNNFEGVQTSLTKGVYLVKAGHSTQKVLVK